MVVNRFSFPLDLPLKVHPVSHARPRFMIGAWGGPELSAYQHFPPNRFAEARAAELDMITASFGFGHFPDDHTYSRDAFQAFLRALARGPILGACPLYYGDEPGPILTDLSAERLGFTPGFVAYVVGHEPNPYDDSILPEIGRRVAWIRSRDSTRLAWLVLQEIEDLGADPKQFVEQCITIGRPDVITFENYVGENEIGKFSSNLNLVRGVCESHSTPLWTAIDVRVKSDGTGESEASLCQKAEAVVQLGGSGIIWFPYWTYAPDMLGMLDREGRPARRYGEITRINKYIQSLSRSSQK
jgi:hypothetical protein